MSTSRDLVTAASLIADPEVRAGVEAAIGARGWRSVTAKTGAEVVAACDAGAAVVLLDFANRASARDILAGLRARPDAVGRVIVGLVPADEADGGAAVLAAGADDCLGPPFDAAHLEARLAVAAGMLARTGRALGARDASPGAPADGQLTEHQLLMVSEHAPCGILVIQGGRVLYANAALTCGLGYDRGTLAGRQLAELVDPSDYEAAFARLRAATDSGVRPPPRETRFVRRNGRPTVLELAPGQRIRLGGEDALLAVTHDVTERRRFHSRLILADRLMAVGTLAAGVAHEVNNPLAYVMSSLTYVLEHVQRLVGTVPPVQLHKLESAVADAREGAERVGQIVADLKVFARADEDSRHELDVRAVLQTCINMAWNEIRPRARLVRDFADAPRVLVNEARLAQVFLNLLLNAAQAITPGGVEGNEIRVATRGRGKDHTLVEISDTGCGIAPEHLDRIFDPFFTTKAEGVGTGLGLSVCHGIVTALGGEVTVTSEVGKGTTFRVSLPAVAHWAARARAAGGRRIPTPVGGSPAITAAGAPGQGVVQATPRPRVLAVDDEPMIAALLVRLLEGRYDVTAVTSGAEALERLRAGASFDVLICDLLMPGISGIDLHEALRKLAPRLADRTIFLSGGAFTPHARAFLDRVRAPYLTKPFDVEELNTLIQAFLG